VKLTPGDFYWGRNNRREQLFPNLAGDYYSLYILTLLYLGIAGANKLQE